MKRFFVIAVAAALAAIASNNSWSYGGQAGGGGAGGAGGSGGAAESSGNAESAGTAGTAGASGTADAGGAGGQGAVGASGTAGGNANQATRGNAGGTGANRNVPGASVNGNTAAGVDGNAQFNANQNQNPNQNQIFNGINQTPFFADPNVRSQLQLNDRQLNQLNSAYDRAFQRYNRSLNSPAQRRANTRAFAGANATAANDPTATGNTATPVTDSGTAQATGTAAADRNNGVANRTAGTSNRTTAAPRTAGATNRTTGTVNRTTGTANGTAGVRNTTRDGNAAGTATADRRIITDRNALTDPAQQEQLARMQQLEVQFFNDFNGSLDGTFTDPAMRDRFNQLNTQFQGVGASNNPRVQQQLNLTAQQRQKLATLNGQYRRELTNLQRGSRENLTQEQFDALRSQFANRLNGVLTPEQQQMWSQMTGEPFNFPVNSFFPTTPNTAGQPGIVEGTPGQINPPQNRSSQLPQDGATQIPGTPTTVR